MLILVFSLVLSGTIKVMLTDENLLIVMLTGVLKPIAFQWELKILSYQRPGE